MSKQGLMYAAIAAASIATALAADRGAASADVAQPSRKDRVLRLARRGSLQRALRVGQTARLVSDPQASQFVGGKAPGLCDRPVRRH